jgi:hypothetical protein
MASATLLPGLVADGKGRGTTAGIPGLSPLQRLIWDYRGAQRMKTQSLAKDASDKKEAAIAPDGDRPTTSPEAQLGRVMHSRDIIARLRKLNPNFIFERSNAMPSVMGIYHVVDGEKRHIMGFEFGYSPEFTINHTNEEGEIEKQTRGWRMVVGRLIRARMITKTAAENAFNILPGPDSRNWHLMMQ